MCYKQRAFTWYICVINLSYLITVLSSFDWYVSLIRASICIYMDYICVTNLSYLIIDLLSSVLPRILLYLYKYCQ